MFCLRTWLPLFFIPTHASPIFLFIFFLCTYFINRPCVYCSLLLFVIFAASCSWSDRCLIDIASNWFQPSPGNVTWIWEHDGTAAAAAADETETFGSAVVDMFNTTVGALATVTGDQIARTRVEWTGLGFEWLRSLLGRREWRIECLDLYIRL